MINVCSKPVRHLKTAMHKSSIYKESPPSKAAMTATLREGELTNKT
jgi:hypothetical protein